VKRGPVAPELWVRSPSLRADDGGRVLTLPGLDVEVAAAFESMEGDGSVWKLRFPVGTSDLSLRLAAATSS
jgi:hypothetical protein